MNNIDVPDFKPANLTINRLSGEEKLSGILSRNIVRLKIFLLILMGLVLLSAPFTINRIRGYVASEISGQAPNSSRTPQEWSGFLTAHTEIIIIMLLSFLLILFIIYFLLTKNQKLIESQALNRENAEKFKLITDNITEMISKHSLDGRYTYLSPSCRNILGYEPEELFGACFYDLVHDENAEAARQSHKAILTSTDTNVFTYRIRRKDGAYVWLETSNIILRDPQTNAPVEIMSVSRDVTKKAEQKNLGMKMIVFAEELLQTGAKQAGYQKILENLLTISEATIGFITLLDEKTDKFTTQAVAGPKSALQKMEEILGYKIPGHVWPDYYREQERVKEKVVSRFDSFDTIFRRLIPAVEFARMEQTMHYGETIVIKIIADDQIIGDFTLIMPVGECLKNDYFLEIYSRQINIFMTRLLAEEKLKTSESRHLSAQSMAHVGNWELNIITGQMWASREAFKIYGIPYNAQSISYESVKSSVFPEYRKRLDEVLKNLIARNEPYDEKFKIKNILTGKTHYVQSRAIRLTDEQGIPVKIVGAIQDITDYKKSEEEILFLSFHDQLTGLYNRRYYEEKLAVIDKPENLPITIAMGDVNGLKLVNDSFGHAAGDELLRKAAEVIKNGCREMDLVARLGGDEFVIILPQTGADEAEKMIRHITELSVVEKIGAIDLSISFGYATKNTTEESIHETFKETEDHMYRHKLCESTSMRNKTIDLIINTLYEKNHREMVHSKRVGSLCEAFATRMNLDKDDINQIKTAGLMHDIGKIGIDDKILNKPSNLLKDEWKDVERHSEIGYRILSSVNEFSEIADYVLEHHERWDGTGYPRGLKGKEISLQARIIAFADSYDAMTGYRTYRSALNRKEALEEIRRGVGTQFDPEIAEVFIEMLGQDDG